METLRRVSSKIPLDTSGHIVAFMQELKEFCLWVTEGQFDTGYPEVIKESAYLVHKPYVDKSLPKNEIREFAWVIGLDSQLYPIYIDLLSIGDMTRAEVPLGMVHRGTAMYGASSIILVHNHPSGRTEPSNDDINMTKNIIELGSMIRRPLSNHVIMGVGDEHYSFADDEGTYGLEGLATIIYAERLAPEMLIEAKKMLAEFEKMLAESEKTIIDAKKTMAEQQQQLEENRQKLKEKEQRIADLEKQLKGQ